MSRIRLLAKQKPRSPMGSLVHENVGQAPTGVGHTRSSVAHTRSSVGDTRSSVTQETSFHASAIPTDAELFRASTGAKKAHVLKSAQQTSVQQNVSQSHSDVDKDNNRSSVDTRSSVNNRSSVDTRSSVQQNQTLPLS